MKSEKLFWDTCRDYFEDIGRICNLEKIKKMESFPEDWDGAGGSAFSKKAIEMFKHVIIALNLQRLFLFPKMAHLLTGMGAEKKVK